MEKFDIEDKILTKKLVTLEQAKKLDQVGYNSLVLVMYYDDGSEGGVFQVLKTGEGDLILLTNQKINNITSMEKANNSHSKHYRAPFKWDAIHWLEKLLGKIVLLIPLGDNYVYPVIANLQEPLDIVSALENLTSGMTKEEAIDHALNELLNFSTATQTIIHEKEINNS